MEFLLRRDVVDKIFKKIHRLEKDSQSKDELILDLQFLVKDMRHKDAMIKEKDQLIRDLRKALLAQRRDIELIISSKDAVIATKDDVIAHQWRIINENLAHHRKQQDAAMKISVDYRKLVNEGMVIYDKLKTARRALDRDYAMVRE